MADSNTALMGCRVQLKIPLKDPRDREGVVVYHGPEVHTQNGVMSMWWRSKEDLAAALEAFPGRHHPCNMDEYRRKGRSWYPKYKFGPVIVRVDRPHKTQKGVLCKPRFFSLDYREITVIQLRSVDRIELLMMED